MSKTGQFFYSTSFFEKIRKPTFLGIFLGINIFPFFQKKNKINKINIFDEKNFDMSVNQIKNGKILTIFAKITIFLFSKKVKPPRFSIPETSFNATNRNVRCVILEKNWVLRIGLKLGRSNIIPILVYMHSKIFLRTSVCHAFLRNFPTEFQSFRRGVMCLQGLVH